MKATLMRPLWTAVHILLATNLMAQSARLAGMVADSLGARVPGTSVVGTNTATGVASETVSNELGLSVFEVRVLGGLCSTKEGRKKHKNNNQENKERRSTWFRASDLYVSSLFCF